MSINASMKIVISLLSCSLLLGSCSSFKRKVALSTMSDLLYEASFKSQSEPNWEFFKDSLPGTLKLVESLYSLAPTDEKLLASLIKGYSGYAFAIWETESLEDIILEKQESIPIQKALQFYSRAVTLGFYFLTIKGISSQDLSLSTRTPGGMNILFKDKLNSEQLEHREAILYFAQSFGALIYFQKHRLELVAQLPVVKGMFDWVCSNNDDDYYGMCGIFYGSYESAIPKMLGGHPEKGKKIFEDVIKRHPHNWLARMAYIQYYAIPMADKNIYQQQKAILEKASTLLEQKQYWTPKNIDHNAFKEKNLQLFQAIAIKRFHIVKKYEKKIF